MLPVRRNVEGDGPVGGREDGPERDIVDQVPLARRHEPHDLTIALPGGVVGRWQYHSCLAPTRPETDERDPVGGFGREGVGREEDTQLGRREWVYDRGG